MDKTIRFRLNAKDVSVTTSPERMLRWVLRTDLNLTGTKYGCGEGYCGFCTVLLDGKPVRSCSLPLSAVEGKSVLTIEGLAQPNGRLHPIQQAFVDNGALQCGYCTPGQIMEAYALLMRKPDPTEAEIVDALEGNICRCAAYKRIIAAVQQASKALKMKTQGVDHDAR